MIYAKARCPGVNMIYAQVTQVTQMPGVNMIPASRECEPCRRRVGPRHAESGAVPGLDGALSSPGVNMTRMSGAVPGLDGAALSSTVDAAVA